MVIDVAQSAKKLTNRLSKAQWLESALEVLATKGGAALRIQDMCEALGVSRGSFYWHFADREDFINATLIHWHEKYTKTVPPIVEALGTDPEDRLLVLLKTVFEKNLIRYDMPIREWASRDREIAKQVAKTDRFRLSYIRGLFSEMGFHDPELEIRTRSCMAYILAECVLFDRQKRSTQLAQIEASHSFFIGKHQR